MERCDWAANSDVLNKDYHDLEWGTPVHDDTKLFEFLVLEGAQAGLSWSTILKKREGYRKAFDGFDCKKIILYDEKKLQDLMLNPDIVRNRLKILSVKRNAEVFIDIQKEFGTFDKYIWNFSGGKPIVNHFTLLKEIPAKTDLSDKISADLKRRGMNFVGSTIIYAFMQAVGIVDDHQEKCFRKR
ncbi:MAG: DNA-3-methyladenine glycosylase I [Nanoarchaeota archaeon]|nr:DNA-3-methyladenine glycosylase I [Nanoarchaeota archaeon]